MRKNIAKAARRYSRFTGHRADPLVKRRAIPDDYAEIGTVCGVMYETVRDGVKEKYVHQFRLNSRPQMFVSHDGKTVLILGGGFTFTERGFVDRKR